MFCLITIAVFPLLGYFIYTNRVDNDFTQAFINHQPLWIQLITGLIIGLTAACGACKIILLNFMKPVHDKYTEIFSDLNLKWYDVIIISVCAGVGEEILFRGALQPLFGIVLTSVFFVAIHGYLNPLNWRISIYGVYMTLVIMLLGYYTQVYGIYTAIMAHTVIDIILLNYIKKN